MKVFVDSPLAINATEVFREHIECLDQQFVEQLLSEEDQDPLGFRDLYYVRKVAHSKELNKIKEPCIIISASGMCEAGRILHHLKNNIEKTSTTILFSGYQAPHTLGRRLLDGEKQVRIYGDEYTVKAKILKLESASGHADQEALVDWARETADRGRIKQVALVHCELECAEVLREKLLDVGLHDVIIPAPGETMELV